MELKLLPKTRHGKNRLAAIPIPNGIWDGRWIVVDTCDRVRFAPGKHGPWYRVEPLVHFQQLDGHGRWVHATDDDNFIVQQIEGVEPLPELPQHRWRWERYVQKSLAQGRNSLTLLEWQDGFNSGLFR